MMDWCIVFTKWATKRLEGKMKITLNVKQLKELLNTTQSTTASLVKLFHPEEFNALQADGWNKLTMNKVRVNILEVMVAGVLLSKLISHTHKVQFVFGLFDHESSGMLTQDQFACFLKTMFRSLSIVFGIDTHEIPS